MLSLSGVWPGGGDWQTYVEVSWYLRVWTWDSINWELWLKVSQSVRCAAGSPVEAGTPFQTGVGSGPRVAVLSATGGAV